MSLDEKLASDLKDAMRAKDELVRDTLRMIRSQLDSAELAKGGKLDEAEQLDVLSRAVKTRRESAEQYEEGGRAELAAKERAEIVVVERYLPKQLGEAEARAAIEKIAQELGVTEKRQMGQLMGEIKARHQGEIDGKLGARIASSLLK